MKRPDDVLFDPRVKEIGPDYLTKAQWQCILERHRFSCYLCGTDEARLTIEHIVPLARGGLHTAGNVAPACMRCNARKRTRTADEFRTGVPVPMPPSGGDKALGQRIRVLRETAGYGPWQFSWRAGITPATLHNVEAGTRRTFRGTFQKIADALDVDVERLTAGDE